MNWPEVSNGDINHNCIVITVMYYTIFAPTILLNISILVCCHLSLPNLKKLSGLKRLFLGWHFRTCQAQRFHAILLSLLWTTQTKDHKAFQCSSVRGSGDPMNHCASKWFMAVTGDVRRDEEGRNELTMSAIFSKWVPDWGEDGGNLPVY